MHLFYGYEIIRRKEQEQISNILKKYEGQPVSEELKEKVWDELQKKKNEGVITIPFKMVIRRDPSGKFPEYIEVILDTKV